MIYIFPETKFTKMNTVEQQLEHVLSEAEELFKELETSINIIGGRRAKAKWKVLRYSPRMIKEALDLSHSLETLYRIAEANGVNMDDETQETFEKNRGRKYYLGEKKTEGR